jgi:DNA-binding transcriptional LysR family regulator
MLEKENFILLYPDQNTGGIAQSLFKEYSMEPTVLLHTRNSAMSIRLAIQGLGAAFAPESYFREESRFFPEGCCFSIGQKPVLTTTIVAYQKKKYLSQHARDYVEILKEYATSLSVSKGNDI